MVEVAEVVLLQMERESLCKETERERVGEKGHKKRVPVRKDVKKRGMRTCRRDK